MKPRYLLILVTTLLMQCSVKPYSGENEIQGEVVSAKYVDGPTGLQVCVLRAESGDPVFEADIIVDYEILGNFTGKDGCRFIDLPAGYYKVTPFAPDIQSFSMNVICKTGKQLQIVVKIPYREFTIKPIRNTRRRS